MTNKLYIKWQINLNQYEWETGLQLTELQIKPQLTCPIVVASVGITVSL